MISNPPATFSHLHLANVCGQPARPAQKQYAQKNPGYSPVNAYESLNPIEFCRLHLIFKGYSKNNKNRVIFKGYSKNNKNRV